MVRFAPRPRTAGRARCTRDGTWQQRRKPHGVQGSSRANDAHTTHTRRHVRRHVRRRGPASSAGPLVSVCQSSVAFHPVRRQLFAVASAFSPSPSRASASAAARFSSPEFSYPAAPPRGRRRPPPGLDTKSRGLQTATGRPYVARSSLQPAASMSPGSGAAQETPLREPPETVRGVSGAYCFLRGA